MPHAFYAQPTITLGTRIVGRYLKRYVKCAVGKTKALEALAEYERELFYDNGHEVKIDKQHNCVVVEVQSNAISCNSCRSTCYCNRL